MVQESIEHGAQPSITVSMVCVARKWWTFDTWKDPFINIQSCIRYARFNLNIAAYEIKLPMNKSYHRINFSIQTIQYSYLCKHFSLFWIFFQKHIALQCLRVQALLMKSVETLLIIIGARQQIKGNKKKKLAFTTTTSPIDNKGDGRDLGCKEPTNGILPASAKRRVGLLDILTSSNNWSIYNNSS